jgi:hypothetical protein
LAQLHVFAVTTTRKSSALMTRNVHAAILVFCFPINSLGPAAQAWLMAVALNSRYRQSSMAEMSRTEFNRSMPQVTQNSMACATSRRATRVVRHRAGQAERTTEPRGDRQVGLAQVEQVVTLAKLLTPQ